MLYLKLDAEFEPELKSAITLKLEHSLSSMSKWESIHEKPFYNKEQMTPEELVSYVTQMCLTDLDPQLYANRLKADHFVAVMDYINSKQSATWFKDIEQKKSGPSEVITNELIYFWMIKFDIPFAPCEEWHLNRLMTLIKIISIKSAKPKKMSRAEQMAQQRALNEQRRREMGTSG